MDRNTSFRLLRECLASIATGREPGSPFLVGFPWADFIALAHEYRVSAAVGTVLAGSNVVIPPTAKMLFTNLAAQARHRNVNIVQQALEIARILNGLGIEPLFMKGGAALIGKLYPDLAMRYAADLDVLVPGERIDDCVAALEANDVVPLTDYLHPRSHHVPALGRSDLPVPIELHHHVLAFPNWDFFTADEMQSSAIRQLYQGVRLRTPSSTYAVLHNIAHAQLNDHDCLYGRLDLRGLLDLAILTRRHAGAVDWNAIHRRFVDARHAYAFQYHIEWARQLGAEIPLDAGPGLTSRLLCRRASYQVRHPTSLSLSVRLLRPLLLLRRELADATLRRRLARNLSKASWWKRHLGMLTKSTVEHPMVPKSRGLIDRLHSSLKPQQRR